MSTSPVGAQIAETSSSPASTEQDRLYLQAFVRDEAAIEIAADREALWSSRLAPILREFQLPNVAAMVRSMRVGNRRLEDAVINAMTTHETSFFRDGPAFDDIVSTIVPRLLQQLTDDRPLTIWFAASSSGQEVYSLAMQLALQFPVLVRDGRFRLLATDLSHAMVERCRAARFTSLEVRRGLPATHRQRFFVPEGDDWVVREELRDLVLCRQLNLVGPLNPVPRCDLVLIRNVLIYFSDDDKVTVLRNIRRDVLRPDGALVLGASEMMGQAVDDYSVAHLPNGVCYRPKPA